MAKNHCRKPLFVIPYTLIRKIFLQTFDFSDTLDEISRVASEVPHRVTSALNAKKIMEKQIRAEDPEIVHFAPPLKVIDI